MQFLSLHIKGFPIGTSVEDIRDYFHTQTGIEVKAVKITSSNAVLVSFNERDSARLAKERTNGALFCGRELEVFYFEPREIRQLQKLKMLDK